MDSGAHVINMTESQQKVRSKRETKDVRLAGLGSIQDGPKDGRPDAVLAAVDHRRPNNHHVQDVRSRQHGLLELRGPRHDRYGRGLGQRGANGLEVAGPSGRGAVDPCAARVEEAEFGALDAGLLVALQPLLAGLDVVVEHLLAFHVRAGTVDHDVDVRRLDERKVGGRVRGGAAEGDDFVSAQRERLFRGARQSIDGVVARCGSGRRRGRRRCSLLRRGRGRSAWWRPSGPCDGWLIAAG